MPKMFLVDAAIREQPRVAIVENHNKLMHLELGSNKERTKGNIYVGVVSKITNAFEAAFVDYGDEKHGFLSFKSLGSSANSNDENGQTKAKVKERDKILVQVEKERRGAKGAALSAQISLAGSYLVLMPGNPDCNGISKRIDTNDREQTKSIVSQLKIPEGMGVIVRTAGVGQPIEELEWDLQSLITQWDNIKKASDEFENPTLIHQDSDTIKRTLRDYLKKDIEKIIVNDQEAFNNIKEFIDTNRPDFSDRVFLYDTHKVPLFTHYQVEPEIEKLFQTKIDLPSGGSLVIEQCEALTAIDVNSGGATQGQDIEETAFNTNMEAVKEATKQIRLRNISGIIDIDFIDMTKSQNRSKIEQALADAVLHDKAKIKTESISALTGCMRISRQRNGASLSETNQQTCPRCEGTGLIRTISSFSTKMIRQVEEMISEEKTELIMLRVGVDVAAYIMNELRSQLDRLQKVHGTYIMVIPTEGINHPKYFLKRMKFPKGGSLPSQVDEKSETVIDESIPLWSNAQKKNIPATQHHTPKRSQRRSKQQSGIIKQFVSWIFSDSGEEKPQTPQRKTTRNHNSQGRKIDRKGPKRSQNSAQSQSSLNRRSRGPRRMRPQHSKDNSHTKPHTINQTSQPKSVDPLED